MRGEGSTGMDSIRLDELLQAARTDVATPQQLQGLATGLESAVGLAPAAAGATKVATAASGGFTVAGKAAAVVALAAVFATGGYVWNQRHSDAPVVERVHVTPPQGEQPLEPQLEEPQVEHPRTPVPLEALPEVTQPASQSKPKAASAPAEPEQKAEPKKAVVSMATRAADLMLLRQARSALASNPSRALELTAEHARLYPNSELRQERDVIRIEALVKLGRSSEARQRADNFSARFPGSAHSSKVKALRDQVRK